MKVRSLALGLALSALACTRNAPPPPAEQAASAAPSPAASSAGQLVTASAAPPAVPAPKRPYNVVFLMVDSLRADMPWAGYPRPIAPWLTKFAERSTLYPRAYSLSSYTAKSVAPTLVGKYPSEMPRDGYFFTQWPNSNLFVTERLQKAGHRTLSGQGHGYFMASLGAVQGFDVHKLLPGTVLDTTGVHDVTSERLTEQAKQLLSNPENVSQDDGKRFFLYVHFLDPHHEYYKHPSSPDFGNARRDLYDNEVHFTDYWVGQLIDWVQAQPFGRDTAFIITADHGEGFGERGQYRHSYELWEALVRVPLFIHVPGAPPRRIEQPRSGIDLAPTIADLMGILEGAEPPLRGRSLLPEVFGAPAEPRPVVVDLPRCDLMDRRRGVIDGPWKLLAFGDDYKFMLFNVEQDPKEEQDLAAKEPEQLERMKKLYQELSATIPNEPVVGGAPLKGARGGQRW